MIRGVIVRTKKTIRRRDGSYVKLTAMLWSWSTSLTKGTRIFERRQELRQRTAWRYQPCTEVV